MTPIPPPVSSRSPSAEFHPSYIWLISTVAALGGLLFGWDWVVIGGAKPFFESFFQLKDPSLVGWANSCALLGCLAGAIVTGTVSDRFGRRRPLLFAALLFAATSLGDAFAGTFTVFVAWRILGGVAIGLASGLSPLYISQIAPAARRGRLVSLNQLTIVIGILLAQYLNWFLVRKLPASATDEFIRGSWFGQEGWRWMFGLTAAPSALFFFGMCFVPESPRWLAQRRRDAEARAILARVAGPAHAEAEMLEIRRALASGSGTKVSLRELLDPKLRRVLVLGIVLAVF
ncbi:MAG TPA: MFS transporter, partial [Opitutaceae bacterium]|nr:MFS transporter [Opitutaceae bacterium]